uniref:Autophagy-related protein 2 n=1 Tax=Chromera velia CCMP2878 TaxID=1169474 RepID=A0A0G4G1P4_9ALVE|eukprot:Cvel_19741.t1-p1 / transcript=Cvel_19741.t1 / gene=Cvel_19741 / organism=Chromera_velia_CCMP2878 / gene_product=Autophagy-related protein 2, putative / transcript_product=Autophagy-related protein 2, putative / location=Cvel_scaffold1727:4305-17508(+) / protein_length=3614 / sequence_SO=supercontig / SO=protein_coding / is_pseudo=false
MGVTRSSGDCSARVSQANVTPHTFNAPSLLVSPLSSVQSYVCFVTVRERECQSTAPPEMGTFAFAETLVVHAARLWAVLLSFVGQVSFSALYAALRVPCWRLSSYLLGRILGQVIDADISPEDVSFSFTEARLRVKNVKLNLESLNSLIDEIRPLRGHLHGEVWLTEGLIRELEIFLPWHSLFTDSCRIFLSGVECGVVVGHIEKERSHTDPEGAPHSVVSDHGQFFASHAEGSRFDRREEPHPSFRHPSPPSSTAKSSVSAGTRGQISSASSVAVGGTGVAGISREREVGGQKSQPAEESKQKTLPSPEALPFLASFLRRCVTETEVCVTDVLLTCTVVTLNSGCSQLFKMPPRLLRHAQVGPTFTLEIGAAVHSACRSQKIADGLQEVRLAGISLSLYGRPDSHTQVDASVFPELISKRASEGSSTRIPLSEALLRPCVSREGRDFRGILAALPGKCKLLSVATDFIFDSEFDTESCLKSLFVLQWRPPSGRVKRVMTIGGGQMVSGEFDGTRSHMHASAVHLSTPGLPPPTSSFPSGSTAVAAAVSAQAERGGLVVCRISCASVLVSYAAIARLRPFLQLFTAVGARGVRVSKAPQLDCVGWEGSPLSLSGSFSGASIEGAGGEAASMSFRGKDERGETDSGVEIEESKRQSESGGEQKANSLSSQFGGFKQRMALYTERLKNLLVFGGPPGPLEAVRALLPPPSGRPHPLPFDSFGPSEREQLFGGRLENEEYAMGFTLQKTDDHLQPLNAESPEEEAEILLSLACRPPPVVRMETGCLTAVGLLAVDTHPSLKTARLAADLSAVGGAQEQAERTNSRWCLSAESDYHAVTVSAQSVSFLLQSRRVRGVVPGEREYQQPCAVGEESLGGQSSCIGGDTVQREIDARVGKLTVSCLLSERRLAEESGVRACESEQMVSESRVVIPSVEDEGCIRELSEEAASVSESGIISGGDGGSLSSSEVESVLSGSENVEEQEGNGEQGGEGFVGTLGSLGEEVGEGEGGGREVEGREGEDSLFRDSSEATHKHKSSALRLHDSDLLADLPRALPGRRAPSSFRHVSLLIWEDSSNTKAGESSPLHRSAPSPAVAVHALLEKGLGEGGGAPFGGARDSLMKRAKVASALMRLEFCPSLLEAAASALVDVKSLHRLLLREQKGSLPSHNNMATVREHQRSSGVSRGPPFPPYPEELALHGFSESGGLTDDSLMVSSSDHGSGAVSQAQTFFRMEPESSAHQASEGGGGKCRLAPLNGSSPIPPSVSLPRGMPVQPKEGPNLGSLPASFSFEIIGKGVDCRLDLSEMGEGGDVAGGSGEDVHGGMIRVSSFRVEAPNSSCEGKRKTATPEMRGEIAGVEFHLLSRSQPEDAIACLSGDDRSLKENDSEKRLQRGKSRTIQGRFPAAPPAVVVVCPLPPPVSSSPLSSLRCVLGVLSLALDPSRVRPLLSFGFGVQRVMSSLQLHLQKVKSGSRRRTLAQEKWGGGEMEMQSLPVDSSEDRPVSSFLLTEEENDGDVLQGDASRSWQGQGGSVSFADQSASLVSQPPFLEEEGERLSGGERMGESTYGHSAETLFVALRRFVLRVREETGGRPVEAEVGDVMGTVRSPSRSAWEVSASRLRVGPSNSPLLFSSIAGVQQTAAGFAATPSVNSSASESDSVDEFCEKVRSRIAANDFVLRASGSLRTSTEIAIQHLVAQADPCVASSKHGESECDGVSRSGRDPFRGVDSLVRLFLAVSRGLAAGVELSRMDVTRMRAPANAKLTSLDESLISHQSVAARVEENEKGGDLSPDFSHKKQKEAAETMDEIHEANLMHPERFEGTRAGEGGGRVASLRAPSPQKAPVVAVRHCAVLVNSFPRALEDGGEASRGRCQLCTSSLAALFENAEVKVSPAKFPEGRPGVSVRISQTGLMVLAGGNAEAAGARGVGGGNRHADGPARLPESRPDPLSRTSSSPPAPVHTDEWLSKAGFVRLAGLYGFCVESVNTSEGTLKTPRVSVRASRFESVPRADLAHAAFCISSHLRECAREAIAKLLTSLSPEVRGFGESKAARPSSCAPSNPLDARDDGKEGQLLCLSPSFAPGKREQESDKADGKLSAKKKKKSKGIFGTINLITFTAQQQQQQKGSSKHPQKIPLRLIPPSQTEVEDRQTSLGGSRAEGDFRSPLSAEDHAHPHNYAAMLSPFSHSHSTWGGGGVASREVSMGDTSGASEDDRKGKKDLFQSPLLAPPPNGGLRAPPSLFSLQLDLAAAACAGVSSEWGTPISRVAGWDEERERTQAGDEDGEVLQREKSGESFAYSKSAGGSDIEELEEEGEEAGQSEEEGEADEAEVRWLHGSHSIPLPLFPEEEADPVQQWQGQGKGEREEGPPGHLEGGRRRETLSFGEGRGKDATRKFIPERESAPVGFLNARTLDGEKEKGPPFASSSSSRALRVSVDLEELVLGVDDGEAFVRYPGRAFKPTHGSGEVLLRLRSCAFTYSEGVQQTARVHSGKADSEKNTESSGGMFNGWEVEVKDLEVSDHVSSSSFTRVLSRWTSKDLQSPWRRPVHTPFLKLSAEAVDVTSGLNIQGASALGGAGPNPSPRQLCTKRFMHNPKEYRVKMSLVPLRFSLDQDTLELLLRFSHRVSAPFGGPGRQGVDLGFDENEEAWVIEEEPPVELVLQDRGQRGGEWTAVPWAVEEPAWEGGGGGNSGKNRKKTSPAARGDADEDCGDEFVQMEVAEGEDAAEIRAHLAGQFEKEGGRAGGQRVSLAAGSKLAARCLQVAGAGARDTLSSLHARVSGLKTDKQNTSDLPSGSHRQNRFGQGAQTTPEKASRGVNHSPSLSGAFPLSFGSSAGGGRSVRRPSGSIGPVMRVEGSREGSMFVGTSAGSPSRNARGAHASVSARADGRRANDHFSSRGAAEGGERDTPTGLRVCLCPHHGGLGWPSEDPPGREQKERERLSSPAATSTGGGGGRFVSPAVGGARYAQMQSAASPCCELLSSSALSGEASVSVSAPPSTLSSGALETSGGIRRSPPAAGVPAPSPPHGASSSFSGRQPGGDRDAHAPLPPAAAVSRPVQREKRPAGGAQLREGEEVEDGEDVFIQEFTMEPFAICLDYRAKRVDLSALRKGSVLELLNAVPLEGLSLRFESVRLYGTSGVGTLAREVADYWLKGVKSSEGIRACLTSIGPVRSLITVGGGVAEVLRDVLGVASRAASQGANMLGGPGSHQLALREGQQQGPSSGNNFLQLTARGETSSGRYGGTRGAEPVHAFSQLVGSLASQSMEATASAVLSARRALLAYSTRPSQPSSALGVPFRQLGNSCGGVAAGAAAAAAGIGLVGFKGASRLLAPLAKRGDRSRLPRPTAALKDWPMPVPLGSPGVGVGARDRLGSAVVSDPGGGRVGGVCSGRGVTLMGEADLEGESELDEDVERDWFTWPAVASAGGSSEAPSFSPPASAAVSASPAPVAAFEDGWEEEAGLEVLESLVDLGGSGDEWEGCEGEFGVGGNPRLTWQGGDGLGVTLGGDLGGPTVSGGGGILGSVTEEDYFVSSASRDRNGSGSAAAHTSAVARGGGAGSVIPVDSRREGATGVSNLKAGVCDTRGVAGSGLNHLAAMGTQGEGESGGVLAEGIDCEDSLWDWDVE